MDLIYLLTSIQDCTDAGMKSLMTIVGYVMLGIKIIAPITLIIVGMIDMTKAIAGKDEDTIKKAQKALGKKAIAAVAVFLIVTLVGLLMGLLGDSGKMYQKCKDCINSPWDCKIVTDL